MDQYERLKVLGRGSYGLASLVRKRNNAQHKSKYDDVNEVQLCVSKEVDLHKMSSEALQETENEVKILQALSHVNIVAYYDTFVEDEMLYILMEYADGGDLHSTVKRRCVENHTFEEVEALSILLQCSRALRHIHARHIVHRDLKSQNIFLTSGGVVKIGDFGIARVLAHTRAMALTVIGTPSHLPPEVCDNRPYGTKADIWSLGVVFYEILTFEPPFKAASLAALVVKIVNGEPKPLAEGAHSAEVCNLVGMMLQKDAARRPSAAKLLRDGALRQVATLNPLHSLHEQSRICPCSSASATLSEEETLTPTSIRNEVQTPPTPEVASGPKIPELPPLSLEEYPFQNRIQVSTEIAPTTPGLRIDRLQEDLKTELDVLSQAIVRREETPPGSYDWCASPSIVEIVRENQRRQPSLPPLPLQLPGSTEYQRNCAGKATGRYKRSLSTGDGFSSVSTAAPRSWDGPWRQRQPQRRQRSDSLGKGPGLEQRQRSAMRQRPRPVPLEDVVKPMPASMPPTPNGVRGTQSGLGVLRRRTPTTPLQPLSLQPSTKSNSVQQHSTTTTATTAATATTTAATATATAATAATTTALAATTAALSRASTPVQAQEPAGLPRLLGNRPRDRCEDATVALNKGRLHRKAADELKSFV